MLSTVPARPSSSCGRVEREQHGAVARAVVRVAERRDADDLDLGRAGRVSTVVRSPRSQPDLVGDANGRRPPRRRPAGRVPSTRSNGLSAASSVQAAPTGAAPMPRSSTASPSGRPPGRSPRRGRRPRPRRGRGRPVDERVVDGGVLRRRRRPRSWPGRGPARRCPRSASAKTPESVARMVSVKTSEPAMNATPSSTASTVDEQPPLVRGSPRRVSVQHGSALQRLHAVEDPLGGGRAHARRRCGRRRGTRPGRRSSRPPGRA